MEIEGVHPMTTQGRKLTVKVDNEKAAANLVSVLVKEGQRVSDVFRESSDLESLFEGNEKND